MNNSYVEVTIPDGMLEYMWNIRSAVDKFLLKSKQEHEMIYVKYRSLWTLWLIEHKTCIGVVIPEDLTEWVKEIFYCEEYWCVEGSQLYYSLRDLVWLFQANDKALLNQVHALHFTRILNKFKGENK